MDKYKDIQRSTLHDLLRSTLLQKFTIYETTQIILDIIDKNYDLKKETTPEQV